jgi:hypothetical protein
LSCAYGAREGGFRERGGEHARGAASDEEGDASKLAALGISGICPIPPASTR